MLNVSTLREIHRKEFSCVELVKLERDFYQRLRKAIHEKELELRECADILKVKELEHMRQLAKALVQKRKEKLIYRIIVSGGHLPESDGLTEEEMAFAERVIALYRETVVDFDGNASNSAEGMVEKKEEGQGKGLEQAGIDQKMQENKNGESNGWEEIFNVKATDRQERSGLVSCKGTISLNEESVISLPQEEDKPAEKLKTQGYEDFAKVLILVEIEPYKGFDGNVYGPYKKGMVVRLPREEADWLLQNKLAKPVEG